MTSQSFQLFWEDLTVSVPVENDNVKCSRKLWCKILHRKHMKTLNILNGVSGYAETGDMFAILGPSGAGKTTFLAALARRLKLTSGTVKINGHNVTKEMMKGISSYIPQFDVLPSAITPREYMLFMCALKMGNSCSASRRKSLGKQLLRDLGLYECSDTVILKLSGGERKRLSLAADLLTKPKILFLDEPTAGLDTFAATCVVQSLKLIASKGTIIFCTIHQPGMTIYNMFSHMILMVDGRFAHFGTLRNAAEFFKSQNYHCPENYDESEYYVNILSRQNQTDCNIELCQAFSQSPLSKMPAVENAPISHVIPRKKSGWFTQFYWLLWRKFLQDRRATFQNWTVWLYYSLSIVLIGIFFYDTNLLTQKGILNTRGALYMMVVEIVFNVAYDVVYELPSEIVLYLRESTVYAPGPYYSAIVLGLVLKAAFKALLFTIVMYFVLNSEFWLLGFCYYCLSTTTAAICGVAYAMAISSWIDNIDIAITIMVPLDLMFLLMAGMFYNLRTLPNYLAFFKYSSIFYYASEAISITHWSGVKDIDCPANYNLPCLLNGTEVLTEYGYNEGNFWWDIIGMLLLTISMNIVGYIGTRRRRVLKSIF